MDATNGRDLANAKIQSFADYRKGWNFFGEGDAFLPGTIDRACRLLAITGRIWTSTDAIPDPDGSIELLHGKDATFVTVAVRPGGQLDIDITRGLGDDFELVATFIKVSEQFVVELIQTLVTGDD